MDLSNLFFAYVNFMTSLHPVLLWAIAILSVSIFVGAVLLVDFLIALDYDLMKAGHGSGVFVEDPQTLKKIPMPSVFEPPSKKLSLILPAFNEQLRLPVTLDECLRYFNARIKRDPSFTYEIIVVDDGSSDATAPLAMDYAKSHSADSIRVIRMAVNMGKGAAVRKGMVAARGELVMFADSDGATQITDIEKLEGEIRLLVNAELLSSKKRLLTSSASSSSPAAAANSSLSSTPASLADGDETIPLADVPAAVFGSRAHLEQQALSSRKWYRNVLMYGFHFCVLLVAGPGVRDTQCGFKMLTRAAVRQLVLNQRLKRWCFDVEYVYLCRRLRIAIAEVAVTWTEIAGSKIRFTSILHMLLELLLMKVGYGLGLWGIRGSYDSSR